MAKQKYTDQQHYLIRALVIIDKLTNQLPANVITEMVGIDVPVGTLKMVRKDAAKVFTDKLTLEQYFRRTSQTKRKVK